MKTMILILFLIGIALTGFLNYRSCYELTIEMLDRLKKGKEVKE